MQNNIIKHGHVTRPRPRAGLVFARLPFLQFLNVRGSCTQVGRHARRALAPRSARRCRRWCRRRSGAPYAGTGTRRAVETRLGCPDTSSAEAIAVITLAVEPPSRSPHTTLRRRLDVADDLKRSRLQRSPVSLRTLRTMPVFGKASIAYGCLCRRTAVASAVGERRAVTRRRHDVRRPRAGSVLI